MLFVSEPCCTPLTELALSDADATELAAMFKAIADPVRLRLLSVVASSPTGEVCACDLPVLFDRSQPTMSHHLKLLVKAGLLEREQRGKWAWFRAVPARLDTLSMVLRSPVAS
jgi:ArsR family transcriptional regulator